MRHGSLFSGIGGFDLASEWMGWENVFHCEWNEFGQKVLKYYWPKAITYNDITKTDFSIHRGTIDIITGGFPCQPYSTAGKRKGKEDERHLWPEMLRAIREIQPSWVVGENVLGLVNWNRGLVFEEVQAELETEGYEVQSFILPAASVNAPHKRDRVWFVAYSRKFRLEQCEDTREMGTRQNKLQEKGSEFTLQFETNGKISNATNSNNSRLKTFSIQESELGKENRTTSFSRDGSRFIRRGLQWESFPISSPICSRNDGISDRLDSITFSKWRQESIKAGGNAIVPQVVYQIFKAIQQYNNLNN